MMSQTHIGLILGCICLLSMSKSLNENNYVPWISRRLRAFCGSAGVSTLFSKITMMCHPKMRAMQQANSFLSANHEIRKHLFLEYSSIANGDTTQVGACLKDVFSLMRFHEIQHLVMIDRFIIARYPELMKLKCLQGLETRYSVAMTALARYPSDEMG